MSAPVDAVCMHLADARRLAAEFGELRPASTPQRLRERIARLVHIDDRGCWVWQGLTDPNGYASVDVRGRGRPKVRAHRLTYVLYVGPIPKGLQIDHLCRNRACVNPAHLEPVTPRENVLRGVGLSSLNARKTHCPQGHSYSVENTLVRPLKRNPDRNWVRTCRACARERSRARRARGLT